MSTEHTAAPAIADMSEQMQIRLEKRAKLIESGREAYPVGLLDSEGNRVEPNHIEGLRAEYDPKLAAEELKAGDETDRVVHVGGRVVFVRNTGKLCFATLQVVPRVSASRRCFRWLRWARSPWRSGSPWLTWVTTCS